MREFKSKPKPVLTDLRKVEEFVAGAVPKKAPAKPPAKLDPDAPPAHAMTLRLNEYELELLREVASKERRSVQNTIKILLIPAARAALGR